MNGTFLKYFEQTDVLHLRISDEPEGKSIELSSNITVEQNNKNEMVGVEILKASAFMLDMIQELLQASSLHVIVPTFPRNER
jgi:uncharacterized protein YuzE